jgi:hypothetical protein
MKLISVQFKQKALFQFRAWYYSGNCYAKGIRSHRLELQLHFSVINVSMSLWDSKAH